MTLDDIIFFDDIKYINSRMSRAAMLAQLTEESAELTQAAAKQLRAERIVDNPTPVSAEEGKERLREELCDVIVAVIISAAATGTWPVESMIRSKMHRWRERLEAEDQAHE